MGSNEKRVPAGRRGLRSGVDDAADAVMRAEMSLPTDPSPFDQSDGRRPRYNRAPVLPQVPPVAEKTPPLDVNLPRRTQSADPRA